MPSSLRPARDSGVRSRPAPPEELTITHWPLRDQSLSSSIAITLAMGAVWLSVWATDNWIVGALLGVSLALTLWKTWLPVNYELTASGITQGILGIRRRIAWASIRAYDLRAGGVLLFPDEVVTPLSPLRGLYLRWGDRKDDVLAHIHYYLHTHTSA